MLGTSFVFASNFSSSGAGVGTPFLLKDRILFGGWDYATGYELYSSDGTIAGTKLVKDVFPGQGQQFANSGFGGDLTRMGLGSVAVYHGLDGVVGNEAWVTDGTFGGTYSITDFVADPLSIYGGVTAFTQVGGLVFCVNNDGIHGLELYVIPVEKAGAAWAEKAGSGCPGTGASIAALNAVGAPTLGNSGFACRMSGARPNAACVLEVSAARSPVAIGGGCTLYVALPTIGVSGITDAAGVQVEALPIPNTTSLLGGSLWLQTAILDPAGAWFGIASFSDALWVLIGK